MSNWIDLTAELDAARAETATLRAERVRTDRALLQLTTKLQRASRLVAQHEATIREADRCYYNGDVAGCVVTIRDARMAIDAALLQGEAA